MKYLILSVSGFLLPVVCVLILSGDVSGSNTEKIKLQETEASNQNDQLPAIDQSQLLSGIENNQSNLSSSSLSSGQGPLTRVASSEHIDPSEERVFLLSFKVKFSSFPAKGKRHNLITKYQAEEFPYSGWSVGLSHLGTRLRPEIYWRGGDGSGGWYTFSDVELELDKWHSFTALILSGEYASLFVETEELQFMGGANLDRVDLPGSDSDLLIGSSKPGPDFFKGEISSLLIAEPDDFPSTVEQLKQFLKGGPEVIAGKIAKSEVLFEQDSHPAPLVEE